MRKEKTVEVPRTVNATDEKRIDGVDKLNVSLLSVLSFISQD